MAVTTGQKRAEVILRIKGALAEGKAANVFIAEMREAGLSYRRTTMLADWRNVSGIEKKTGLLRYVRKDYLPTTEVAQVREWNLSREYMYKVRVRSRLTPDAPITDRFVNIVTDRALTPREIESQTIQMMKAQSPKRLREVVAAIPETAIRRAG